MGWFSERGGDTSSAAQSKRAAISKLRLVIAQAIDANEYVIIRWRDDNGALCRDRVVPIQIRQRSSIVTACGKIIDLNKVQEVVR